MSSFSAGALLQVSPAYPRAAEKHFWFPLTWLPLWTIPFNPTQMVDFYRIPSALRKVLLPHGMSNLVTYYMEKYVHSSRQWPILTDFKGVKENKSSISCYEHKEKDQPKWVSLHCFLYYNFYFLIIIKRMLVEFFF